MTPELSEFINNESDEIQSVLKEYYELYLQHDAHGNETKASNDVLAFCKKIQSNPNRDLESEITNKIDEMKGPELDRGLGARLKKSRKSKKSKKSKDEPSSEDEDKPKKKRGPNGYILFSNANRDEVKEKLHVGDEKPKNTEVMKELATMWQGLEATEKADWNAKAKAKASSDEE